jgi:hypothetical protein
MDGDERRANAKVFLDKYKGATPSLEMHKVANVQSEDDELVASSTMVRSGLLSTVVVGLAMLVVGMLAGYLGRPLVTPQPVIPTPVAVTDAGPPAAAGTNPSAANLMDAVAAETRHFKGDPNAPVVIIEFGDFR